MSSRRCRRLRDMSPEAPMPDLGFVDALARLELEAQRLGWTVRLVDPSPELVGLLDLVGLAEIVKVAVGDASALELGGKPEHREQLRIQEVVEPGDEAL